MKRGSMKSNTSAPIDSASFFDSVIVPSEGKAVDLVEGEHLVPPLRALEVNEVWDRDFARSRLSIPRNAKVVYVQLGAGRINDIEGDLSKVIDALFEHDNVVVVLGESMLGDRLLFT